MNNVHPPLTPSRPPMPALPRPPAPPVSLEARTSPQSPQFGGSRTKGQIGARGPAQDHSEPAENAQPAISKLSPEIAHSAAGAKTTETLRSASDPPDKTLTDLLKAALPDRAETGLFRLPAAGYSRADASKDALQQPTEQSEASVPGTLGTDDQISPDRVAFKGHIVVKKPNGGLVLKSTATEGDLKIDTLVHLPPSVTAQLEKGRESSDLIQRSLRGGRDAAPVEISQSKGKWSISDTAQRSLQRSGLGRE